MATAVKNEGVVFTPAKIAEYMASFIDNSKPQMILEPSCGTGSLIQYIDTKHDLLGVDINGEFIAKCKSKYPKFKFMCKDFVDFHTKNRYDYIISNPPYVKIQNIKEQNLQKMREEYPDIIYGNTNLYAYFVRKCFDLLNEDGRMIFIIPNSFLYNKSLEKLKEFLFDYHRVELLIDFKEEQMFSDYTTYTCIIVITKQYNKKYKYGNNINSKLQNIVYTRSSTVLNSSNTTCDMLLRPKIGLMTLCDHVYIIKEYLALDGLIKFKKDGVQYSIESNACRDILKVSKNKVHKIIYPYIVRDNKSFIDELFLSKYPKCAKYLRDMKPYLLNRDNGNTTSYPKWYAFGRTQSIIPHNRKRVFLPTTIKNIKDSVFQHNVELYYSGMWIQSDRLRNNQIIALLKRYEDTILKKSSNKAGGWYGITNSSFADIC